MGPAGETMRDDLNAYRDPLVFTSEQVREAVGRLAKAVAAWAGKSGSLNVVSVLEGAKPLTAGLQKRLRPGLECSIREVKVKATMGTTLSLARKVTNPGWDPAVYRGARVLVVDDLLDSGETISFLKMSLLGAGAAEVKAVVLVRKFKDSPGLADFVGIEMGLDRATLAKRGLKDLWLYGYGMDLDGQNRELTEIRAKEIPLA